MNQIDRVPYPPRDCLHALKLEGPRADVGGMRPESSDQSPDTTPAGGLAGTIRRANDCLRLAVEAVSSLTEAPVRMTLIDENRRRQIFEALEEFELGGRGRRFVVSVDPRENRVVVISAGRLT